MKNTKLTITDLVQKKLERESNIALETEQETPILSNMGVLSEDGSLTFVKQLFNKIKELTVSTTLFEEKIERLTPHFLSRENIDPKVYEETKELVEQIKQFKTEKEKLLTSQEYLIFNSLFKQWVDFKHEFDDACNGVNLCETQLNSIEEDSEKIIELLVEFEDEYAESRAKEAKELMDNKFKDMVKLSGKIFKDFMKEHEVRELDAYVLDVQDKEGIIQTSQILTLNDHKRIRPPMNVISEDTIIFINDIKFYNREDGIILGLEDFLTILN